MIDTLHISASLKDKFKRLSVFQYLSLAIRGSSIDADGCTLFNDSEAIMSRKIMHRIIVFNY